MQNIDIQQASGTASKKKKGGGTSCCKFPFTMYIQFSLNCNPTWIIGSNERIEEKNKGTT